MLKSQWKQVELKVYLSDLAIIGQPAGRQLIAFGLSERDTEVGQGHRGDHLEHIQQKCPTMLPSRLAHNVLPPRLFLCC